MRKGPAGADLLSRDPLAFLVGTLLDQSVATGTEAVA
jgi:hypothetical protein